MKKKTQEVGTAVAVVEEPKAKKTPIKEIIIAALLAGETDSDKIVEKVKETHPEARTTANSVDYYATELRNRGMLAKKPRLTAENKEANRKRANAAWRERRKAKFAFEAALRKENEGLSEEEIQAEVAKFEKTLISKAAQDA
jgi:uncharacterized short protein YbdD (DUF466 family)